MLDSPHTSAPMLMRGNALVVSVGGKREHPQEKAWMLDDSAQWELLFRGDEAFWRSAGALRVAGYDLVLGLTQDMVNDNRTVPMLTRQLTAGERNIFDRSSREESKD